MAAATEIKYEVVGNPSFGFEPEFGLLCACCSQQARDDRIAGALHVPLKWDRLLKAATHHRVLPAVFFALSDRGDVPASIQSALRARFTVHACRVMRFSALLAEILQQFAKRGIEVMAHKGPLLAQRLYGDSTMREFGDLDFLVRPNDIPRARAALRELGYEPQLQLSAGQEQEYLRSGYEYVFGAGAEKSLIELQWQILPRFYAVEFNLNALFERSIRRAFEGRDIRFLGNEDVLLVLCVHAAKHEWAQLGMLLDIAALSRLDVDWERVLAEARRLGILRILLVSLLLARDLLNCPLPASVVLCHEIASAETFLKAVTDRLFRGEESESDSLHYFRRMMALRERWRDRAFFLARLAFTPSVGEWKAMSVPDALFPLYRGLRVVRLGGRLIQGRI